MTLNQAITEIAKALENAMPISGSDSVVSVIYETYDYDKFSLLKSNRPVNKAHVIRLVESMDEEYLLSPITTNEKFQIIDGQHRFTAAKEKGLPIRYIIAQGYGDDHMK